MQNSNKKNELEYNISSKIAELIKDYKFDYDFIELSFIRKINKKISQNQNTFFLDKTGKLLNGGKKCQR